MRQYFLIARQGIRLPSIPGSSFFDGKTLRRLKRYAAFYRPQHLPAASETVLESHPLSKNPGDAGYKTSPAGVLTVSLRDMNSQVVESRT